MRTSGGFGGSTSAPSRNGSSSTSSGPPVSSLSTSTSRVHEDFMSGVLSGVNETPTFFINGVRDDDSDDDSYETKVLLHALERAAAVGPRIDSRRRNR